eukprot:scaffold15108_cov180-Amphora_coffeaeformis.AAC.5
MQLLYHYYYQRAQRESVGLLVARLKKDIAGGTNFGSGRCGQRTDGYHTVSRVCQRLAVPLFR